MIPQVFISYSRKDSVFVRRLVDDLTSRGVDIWLDQRDIKAGERWDTSVQNGLRESDFFMVVLSPDSVASENVLDEIAYAVSKAKHVFPILYRDCDVPYRLARVQYVDFRGDYETGIEKLLGQMQIVGVPIRQADGSTAILPEAANRDEPVAAAGRGRRGADSGAGAKIPVWAWGVGGAAILALLVIGLLFANRDHPDVTLTPIVTPATILAAIENTPTNQPAMPATGTYTPVSPTSTETEAATQTEKPTATRTSLPETPYPMPSPLFKPNPVVYEVRFCDRPCGTTGAQPVDSYPEGTKTVYVTLFYKDFYTGMPYKRTWSNNGQEWLRTECTWQGPENGSKNIQLFDRKGLRSGLWQMEMTSQEEIIGEAQVLVEGSYDYWDPAGFQQCPDF